eukprot:654164-Rhodomonas_salina.2
MLRSIKIRNRKSEANDLTVLQSTDKDEVDEQVDDDALMEQFAHNARSMRKMAFMKKFSCMDEVQEEREDPEEKEQISATPGTLSRQGTHPRLVGGTLPRSGSEGSLSSLGTCTPATPGTLSRQGTLPRTLTRSASENSLSALEECNPLFASDLLFGLACTQDKALSSLATDLPDLTLSMQMKSKP